MKWCSTPVVWTVSKFRPQPFLPFLSDVERKWVHSIRGILGLLGSGLYRDGLKGGPVLLGNNQAGPGRNFSQPRAQLLVHLCTITISFTPLYRLASSSKFWSMNSQLYGEHNLSHGRMKIYIYMDYLVCSVLFRTWMNAIGSSKAPTPSRNVAILEKRSGDAAPEFRLLNDWGVWVSVSRTMS